MKLACKSQHEKIRYQLKSWPNEVFISVRVQRYILQNQLIDNQFYQELNGAVKVGMSTCCIKSESP